MASLLDEASKGQRILVVVLVAVFLLSLVLAVVLVKHWLKRRRKSRKSRHFDALRAHLERRRDD